MTRRSAVIGLGAMGRHHARILAETDGVELVAACDADRERAAEHAALRGCAAVGSVAELPGDLDLAVVATPTTTHREIAEPLLRGGVSVLVEKPIAASLDDADAMISAAEEGGALLAVGHAERFNPIVVEARSLLERPAFVETHRLGIFPGRSLDVDVVLDLMIHDLDLLSWLTGSDLVDVQAVGVDVLTGRVDIANARLLFGSGCTANVTASRVSAEPSRKMRVFAADRYVSVDFVAKSADVFELDRSAGSPEIRRRELRPAPGRDVEPLRGELEDLLAATSEGRAPLVDGAAGRRALSGALRVLEAMDSERERRAELSARHADGASDTP